eukprot:Skav235274  [mRNA]  locus=scaffold874:287174:299725:+ [translate_table: standard]
MGNIACCGHGSVAEPELAQGPPPGKADQEEHVEISPKGVIEEAKVKDLEEIPASKAVSSPTSPTAAEKREQFASRVVSSCSLQGIHVDEEGSKPANRLRKEMGISYMKRLAASKAPWPSWEFKQEKEEFVADGSSYTTVDGHKQTLTCVARWEGSTLVIERRCFREERSIDETTGELHFKLQGLEGNEIAWGRTFKRKGVLADGNRNSLTFVTEERIDTTYGDIAEFGGEGPETRRINVEGVHGKGMTARLR